MDLIKSCSAYFHLEYVAIPYYIVVYSYIMTTLLVIYTSGHVICYQVIRVHYLSAKSR